MPVPYSFYSKNERWHYEKIHAIKNDPTFFFENTADVSFDCVCHVRIILACHGLHHHCAGGEECGGLYHAVASLDNEIPDFHARIADIGSRNGTVGKYYEDIYEVQDKPWPSAEKLEGFASFPGVTLADTRYMTVGLVENYKRLVNITTNTG